jgi:hypothetical protein
LLRNKIVATENQENSLPKNTWRILGLVAVLLLVVTVSAIGFISAGYFDPKPVGTLTAELPLQATVVQGQTQQLYWSDYDLTADNFSLRLTAAHQSGETDAGYGLLMGGDESAFLAAVSPLGYASIAYLKWPVQQPISEGVGTIDDLDGMIANGPPETENGKTIVWPISDSIQPVNRLLDWQTWPHINGGQKSNEIWIDKWGNSFTVWINRELLWKGRISISVSRVGLWSASFNEDSTINFQKLAIFSE